VLFRLALMLHGSGSQPRFNVTGNYGSYTKPEETMCIYDIF